MIEDHEEARDWHTLPVGAWFFEDSPNCANRYSVQERTDSGCTLVCSTPWHHPKAEQSMQAIADLHNAHDRELDALRQALRKAISFLGCEPSLATCMCSPKGKCLAHSRIAELEGELEAKKDEK
jgi:hypothetical protein